MCHPQVSAGSNMRTLHSSTIPHSRTPATKGPKAEVPRRFSQLHARACAYVERFQLSVWLIEGIRRELGLKPLQLTFGATYLNDPTLPHARYKPVVPDDRPDASNRVPRGR